MKKRFISLVAAAALVGGIASVSVPTTAQAGTVAVKGDTQVQMYGFVWATYSWDNQMAEGYHSLVGPDMSNMPQKDAKKTDSKLYQDTYDKTKYSADSWVTRIGFNFKNEDAGLTGKIEGGFFHGTNFRLRRAYVQHNFDNFYVLIGQEWVMEEMGASISAGFESVAGFDEGILRVPQVRIGTKLDLGGANLDLALAFESGSEGAVSQGGGSTLTVNRVVMPYPVVRAKLGFDTGFGSPATVYGWGSAIPVYLSDAGGVNVSDKSETSYAFGAGIKVPVSMVTIGANYNYTDGATNYTGLSNYQPASYYLDPVSNDVKDTTSNAFNINAVISPTPCLSVGGEYDYVKFKNDELPSDPEVQTYVGQVKVKTTKYTTLTLEWRHVKAKDFDVVGAGDDDMSGDQIYARYMYVF